VRARPSAASRVAHPLNKTRAASEGDAVLGSAPQPGVVRRPSRQVRGISVWPFLAASLSPVHNLSSDHPLPS
jgi:hypothetical protein